MCPRDLALGPWALPRQPEQCFALFEPGEVEGHPVFVAETEGALVQRHVGEQVWDKGCVARFHKPSPRGLGRFHVPPERTLGQGPGYVDPHSESHRCRSLRIRFTIGSLAMCRRQ